MHVVDLAKELPRRIEPFAFAADAVFPGAQHASGDFRGEEGARGERDRAGQQQDGHRCRRHVPSVGVVLACCPCAKLAGFVSFVR